LIGISVIDILPYCISSVYFIWHPDWAWASLGKLSALHEIALSVEMNKAGLEEMKFLYMGKHPTLTFTSEKEWKANEQDTGSRIVSR
jgi:arginyl-tRNA--protein-N-Asp/Glu arginylyltransferase